MITWSLGRARNKNVVAISSDEVEQGAMDSTTCELIWLKQLLKELQFGEIKLLFILA